MGERTDPPSCATTQDSPPFLSGDIMSVNRYKVEDYIGVRFGRLVVVGDGYSTYPNGNRKRKFLCVCDCGTEKLVDPYELIVRKKTQSCGCYQSDLTKQLKRKTQEQFIEESKVRYPGLFEYDKVVYTTNKDNVTITCVEHGDFQVSPSNHLKGCGGCPGCKDRNISKANSKDTGWFLKRAEETHGDRFEYNKSVYVHSQQKLVVTCKTHGDFVITAQDHLRGVGCYQCFIDSMRITEAEYVARATKTHNGFYSYENCGFTGVRNKIQITCPKHGVFSQQADNHANGANCPSCTRESGGYGFNPNKPAYLYVLEIEGMPFTFTGYGITGAIVQRLSDHKRNLADCGFKIIRKEKIYCKDGRIVSQAEQELKNHFTCDSRTKGITGFVKESCFNSFDEVFTFAKETLQKIEESNNGRT
jgi:hypothetical protein